MSIPASVIKKGGKLLEEYANLSLREKEVNTNAEAIEDKIYSALIDTQKNISKLLADDNISYQTFSCTHMVPRLSDENPINRVYIAEELLKEVREMILDGRIAYKESASLQEKMATLAAKSRDN